MKQVHFEEGTSVKIVGVSSKQINKICNVFKCNNETSYNTFVVKYIGKSKEIYIVEMCKHHSLKSDEIVLKECLVTIKKT